MLTTGLFALSAILAPVLIAIYMLRRFTLGKEPPVTVPSWQGRAADHMLPAERRGRRTRVCLRVRACVRPRAGVCLRVQAGECASAVCEPGDRKQIGAFISDPFVLGKREALLRPRCSRLGLRGPRPAPEGVPEREWRKDPAGPQRPVSSFSWTKRLRHLAAALAFRGLGSQPWALAWGVCGAAAASLPARSVWGPGPRGGQLTGPGTRAS